MASGSGIAENESDFSLPDENCVLECDDDSRRGEVSWP